MNKLIFGLLGLCVFQVSASSDSSYNLDDLKALYKTESWAELLMHAQDIKPSSRTDEWNQMLTDAALGAFKAANQVGAREDAVLMGQQLLATYPFLSDSKPFTVSFAKELINVAQPCIKYKAKECVANYGNLLTTLSPDAKLAYEEGVKVYQNISVASSVPFFVSALKESKSYCLDEKVAYSLLYTLDLPQHTYYELAKSAALETCGDAALTNFEHHVIESKSVRSALCPTYISEGYVEGIIKQVCES